MVPRPREGGGKKKIVLGLAMLLVATALVGNATATGPLAVEKGFACGVLDANGNVVVTTNSFFAWYASGRTYLHCEASVSNTTGKRITFNYDNTGLLCGIPVSGATDVWHNTIGNNGSSQLTCKGFAHPNGDDVDSASIASAGMG